MSANTEKCSSKDKSYCEYNEFRRLRYFHGMLLDDNDFRAEQQYHAGKRRFLNRMLHGSGVVCGLELKGEKDKRWITITSGLALDCSGNEIWVEGEQKIDLATLLPPTKKSNEGACTETVEDKPKPLCIGIRYYENPTAPVSVYLPSGGCEERTCENSRWKEGYCVEIVDCCVEKDGTGLIKAWCECGDKSYPDDGKFKDLCGKCGTPSGQTQSSATGNAVKPTCKCMTMEEFCEQSVPCGECCSCDKPCFVILGQITVDENGLLQTLCMNECRRYVLTGPLVQNLLSRVLSGAQAYFKMNVKGEKINLPDGLEEYIYNPIKALCWWLPNALEGGKFEWQGCGKTGPAAPPANLEAVVQKLAEDSQKQAEETKELRAVLSRQKLDFEKRIEQILKSSGTAGVTDTVAETVTVDKKNKK